MQRKVKNQRLGATGYVWAFAALTASPHARAHYDRRRAVGDGHPAALRNPVLPIPEPVAPLPSDRPDWASPRIVKAFLMLRPVGLQRVSRIGWATSMRRSCVGVVCCRSPGTRPPRPGAPGLWW